MLCLQLAISFASVYVCIGGITRLSIQGDNFSINGELTYSSTASNNSIKGLLFNSRMIQGIFDDANDTTAKMWSYPDTKQWNATRNTLEFVSNMSTYYSYGLLGFTVGLMGGMPIYHHEGDQTWIVSAYDFETGALNMPFFDRLSLILSEADTIGMATIVQFFYWGQMARFDKNNTLLKICINNTLDWLIAQKYNNIILDVANECSNHDYDGTILLCNSGNMSTTIKYIKNYITEKDVNKSSSIYVGSSLFPGVTPTDELIEASDVILMHGNEKSSQTITNMITTVRQSNAFKQKPIPIVFNEDNDYNFTMPSNNLKSAVDGHASWGYYLQGNNDYIHGYQSPPVNWGVDDSQENAFFTAINQYTH